MADVLATVGPRAESRLRDKFAARSLPYPPQRVHLLALKAERRLELWTEHGGRPRFVSAFPIHAASGAAGPKLREGDEQVPEGLYRVAWLHPNSSYHLSMKLDYPNAFDRERARADGRTNPGGDIFLHGGAVSIGCLALGDAGIEEIFVLAARVGARNVSVLIAPWDLRRRPPPRDTGQSVDWLPSLYGPLATALRRFRP